VDVALVGTVKDTIEALLPRLSTKTDTDYLDRMRAHYKKARERLDDRAANDRNRTPMQPRHDGERPPAGDRCPGLPPRPASGHALR
jgi:pyruvate dehydrogenase (quinone)